MHEHPPLCAKCSPHILRKFNHTCTCGTTTLQQYVLVAGLHPLYVSRRLVLTVVFLLTHVQHASACHTICFCNQRWLTSTYSLPMGMSVRMSKCVAPCCSSLVANMRTFLKNGRLHHSNKTTLLATKITCTIIHHCAQNVCHICREYSITDAPTSTTTLQQRHVAHTPHETRMPWPPFLTFKLHQPSPPNSVWTTWRRCCRVPRESHSHLGTPSIHSPLETLALCFFVYFRHLHLLLPILA